MQKYDIALFPFPFDDLSSGKLRPALCLSDEIGALRHVVMAYITTRVPSELRPTEILLAEAHPEFNATGLDTTSLIQIHRLITVRASVIVYHLGVLPTGFQAEAQSKIKQVFE